MRNVEKKNIFQEYSHHSQRNSQRLSLPFGEERHDKNQKPLLMCFLKSSSHSLPPERVLIKNPGFLMENGCLNNFGFGMTYKSSG